MGEDADRQRIRLGTALLDRAAGTLTRDGGIVPVRAKTWTLLLHFSANAGRVLGKDEILRAVWPDVLVTEDSLTQAVHDARRAIGDPEGRIIRTVARRGYMLAPEDSAPRGPAPAATPAWGPLVAVLPFDLPEPAALPRVLADALAEDVADALARFRTVTPVARYSAVRAAAEAGGDIVAAGRLVGADYVVDGSIRRSGERIRIAFALTGAADGRRLWVDAVEVAAEDPFAAVDLLTRRIAARLVHGVEALELERAGDGSAPDMAARLDLIRGIALLRGYGRGVNEEARRLFERVVAADPRSGLALAYLALSEVVLAGYQDAPAGVLAAARDRALAAVSLSPEEPRCHRILALILLFQKAWQAAERHFRHALDLNPYDADTLAQAAYLAAKRGRPAEGLDLIERARLANPMHPPWYDGDLAVVLFGLGRYEEAAEAVLRIPEATPWRFYRAAACFAAAGRLADAAAAVREARRIDPAADPRRFAAGIGYERAEDTARFVAAVDLALAAADQTGTSVTAGSSS